jgi:hypothetical protein
MAGSEQLIGYAPRAGGSRAGWPATTLRALALSVAVVAVVPVLLLANLVLHYDLLSYRRHAPVLRGLLPRRPTRFVAPLLPVAAYAGAVLIPGTGPGRAIGSLASLALAAVLAEAYSVSLHREAWIAAFEPWLVPQDARPLSGRPLHPEDRRLHHLFRIQLEYSAPLVALMALVPFGSGLLRPTVLALFAAKFLGHAASDYEVFFHWHLHCRVLATSDRPAVDRVVDAILGGYLGPLHGYVPAVYPCEHLLIHHPSNSGPRDAHSPLPYDRTSFLEFCAFAFVALPRYLVAHRIAGDRRVPARTRSRLRVSTATYWAAVALLVSDGRMLGLWLVVVAIHRAVTATRAQYVWHALIDQDRLGHPAGSSIVWVPRNAGTGRDFGTPPPGGPDDLPVVPAPGTDWAFYDNHHLAHHLRPRAHFADYPCLLREPAVRRSLTEAVVIDLAALPTFAQDCWTGRLGRIAARVIEPDAGADVEAVLRRQLAPLPSLRTSFATVTESRPARALDRVLGSAVYRVTGGM